MLTHAQRDMVLTNSSVCLSVCLSIRHTLVFYQNECTSSELFRPSDSSISL